MSMQFSFPPLKNKEILACLKELNIPLTLDELKNPDAKRMREVYEVFVEVLMGVSKDDLRQPQFGAMDAFKYPELHEESISEISMCKTMLKLLNVVGMPDCTIRDFLMPEGPRTKRILSALINFAKFREERLGTYQEFTAQTDQLIDLKVALEEENQTLTQNLQELTVQREAEAPQIKALQEDTGALNEQIEACHKESNELNSEIKRVKAEINTYENDLASDKVMVSKAEKECTRLKSQIVKSPEKLKRALVDMNDQVQVNKTEINDSTSKYRQLQSKSAALEKIDNKLRKRLATMKDCLSDMERSKVLADKIDETRGQVEANEEAIREYEATKQHLRKQISNVQDKLFRLQRDFEEKKHTTTLALEELQSEKLSLERNLGKEKHQADQNNLLLRQKMEQMKLMEESHERDMEVLRGKYEELNTTVRGYHERMLAAMKGTDYSSSNQNRQNQNNLNQQHQQPQPQQAHTPSATSSKSLIPVMAAPPSTPLSANEKALVPVDLQQQYSEEQDGHDAQSDAQPSKPAYTYTPTATKSSANGTTTQRNHTPYMRSNSADTATTPSSRKTPSKLLSLR